ncbi:MAG: MBL fold metallo-hydrolase, partial [Oxalobacteraceae bacterium]|nr:MBL fold metallo-hydrolase [Oxalobacteraceae bacterium]
TQSSIAVSSNGTDWVLINASPDILQQVRSNPALQPARAIRDSGIAAVMVMDAQIDHITGLLMLREGRKKMNLYCTESVWDDLNHGLPLAKVLSHYCGVERHAIEGLSTDETHFVPIEVPGIDGIRFHPMPLKSKAPPYSPHRNNPGPGDNNGLMIESIATGKKVFYAPGLGEIEPHVLKAMQQADCVLVDGTVWTGDEMITLGLTQKTASTALKLPSTVWKLNCEECNERIDKTRRTNALEPRRIRSKATRKRRQLPYQSSVQHSDE